MAAPLPARPPAPLPLSFPLTCLAAALTFAPQIGADYGAGRMLTGDVKAELVGILTEIVERHKAARAGVSEAVVDAFMAVRPMPDLYG